MSEPTQGERPQVGRRWSVQSPFLILVEGSHDRQVVEALLQHEAIQGAQVEETGGKLRIRDALGLVASSTEGLAQLRALLVMQDADQDEKAAFQRIRDAFLRAKLPSPVLPWVPLQKDALTVGAAVLPGDERPGALEDLLMASMAEDPAHDLVQPFLEAATKAVSAGGRRKSPSPFEMGKARTQAFLGLPGIEWASLSSVESASRISSLVQT